MFPLPEFLEKRFGEKNPGSRSIFAAELDLKKPGTVFYDPEDPRIAKGTGSPFARQREKSLVEGF